MNIILISVIVAGILLIALFIFSLPKFKKNKFGKKLKKYYPALISFAALLISYHTLSFSERQSQKRPILQIHLDCSEFASIKNQGDLYMYKIYLTNNGDIDAQVTSLDISYSIDYQKHHKPKETFTIPIQSSYEIIEDKSEKILSSNFLISQYSINYTCSNGNGGVLFGDTIFCK